MSYITPLHGSPAVSWTTNIHPSILWHFVKYNLYQIRCDYPGVNRLLMTFTGLLLLALIIVSATQAERPPSSARCNLYGTGL